MSITDPPPRRDSVDDLIDEWGQVAPELDLATVAVVARLGRVRTLISMRMDAVFESHGITAADFAAMSILRRRGEVPMRSIADRLYLTPGTVTPRIRRLAEAGLVRVRPDAADARVRLVSLTAAGRQRFDEVVPDHLDGQREALRVLDKAQCSQLAELLRVLLCDLES